MIAVLWVLFLIFYFLPTLFAVFAENRKRNINKVFFVNLLTGWCLIGWVVAWFMAITNDGYQRSTYH